MHFLHIEDNDIVNKIRPSNSWDFGSIKPHYIYKNLNIIVFELDNKYGKR
jgi:hypothetical protein